MTSREKEKQAKLFWLKRLGMHIRKMRIEKGFSGAELARELEIDKPNLTRLEKGRVNPSVYLLNRICEVLNLKISDFFKDFE